MGEQAKDRIAPIETRPEIPLIDEGYSYHIPLVIPLRQGWNNILVKLPVGSFKGPDWHNPVKWMFTVVPSEE